MKISHKRKLFSFLPFITVIVIIINTTCSVLLNLLIPLLRLIRLHLERCPLSLIGNLLLTFIYIWLINTTAKNRNKSRLRNCWSFWMRLSLLSIKCFPHLLEFLSWNYLNWGDRGIWLIVNVSEGRGAVINLLSVSRRFPSDRAYVPWNTRLPSQCTWWRFWNTLHSFKTLQVHRMVHYSIANVLQIYYLSIYRVRVKEEESYFLVFDWEL